MLLEFSRRINSDKGLADKLVESLSHEMKLRIANQILSSKLNGKDYTSFIAGRHRRAIAVREVSLSLGVDEKDVKRTIDKDGDGYVSSSELEKWLQNISKIRDESKQKLDEKSDDAKLTSTQIRRLLLISGIPFIGFGILDNGIMIVSGDLIEEHFGAVLGISTLAAAGLGNLLSDIVGLSFGSWVEKGARKLGLQDPKLSLSQLSLKQTKYLQLLASTVGITIGCLIGMLPLWFM